MKQMKTVMQFEFMTFARSGAFIGITIFMILLALVGPAIPRIIELFGDMDIGTERRIAAVDTTGNFDRETIEAYTSVGVSFFQNIQRARDAVTSGDYQYAVFIDEEGFTLYVTAMGMGVWTLGDNIAWMLREQYRAAAFAQIGVDPHEQARILGFVPQSEIMTLGADGAPTEDSPENFFSNMMFSYVLSFVLYFGLLSGGGYLVTAVVREKSTKTMELLITSCKAGKLLNGKVLGVGAAILVQILLLVGAAALSMHFFGGAGGEGALAALNLTFEPFIMTMLVVFFLLGFLMYAYIYAALASTVSRMEDANSIQTLPMLLVMVGFFAAIFGMTNPGAGWVNVLSHIPFFAPFVMFMRICLNTAASWEIFISIAAQITTVCLMAYLGGRIYRMGTLMYGNKPKIKEILATLK
ncbi:MAG: ABC transporter permease [Defluviitaleaceae bacterium]|nr:ABC transporter permease [Defluviitaleaceae bacterium]